MKLEKQNMSLRHRIFLLLLAVGLASFIIAGAVSLAGMYAIRENIDKTGALLADNTASFTENFAEMQVKRRLSADAAATAKLIRHEMKSTGQGLMRRKSRWFPISQTTWNCCRNGIPLPLQVRFTAISSPWM